MPKQCGAELATLGEMAEWLKAHAWKACVPQGTVGSNPTLSASYRSHWIEQALRKVPAPKKRR